MSGLEGLLAGRTLVGRYRIEEVIGRGGFAAVYRAADERLGRPVAVKVITYPAPEPEIREQLRARFQREARAAAGLPQHPNVVTVYDFGTDPELGLDFLVMELLGGEDLATRMRAGSPLPLDQALCIFRDAAAGVAVGHRAGLVHRDVKPGNIFLAEPHGPDHFRVCVLDFGIARVLAEEQDLTRLTQAGVPLSPAYASPEQRRGDRELGPQSDVFSLGVVGYQLLTGEKPFGEGERVDAAAWRPERAIRERAPDVPARVEEVVLRAMAYDPAERYPDAAALLAALEAVMEGDRVAPAAAIPAAGAVPPAAVAAADDRTLLHPEPAPPPPLRPASPAPATRRGSRVGMWAALLVAAIAIGAVGVFALGGDGDGGGGIGGGDRPVVELPTPVADPSAVPVEEPVVVEGGAPPPVGTGSPPAGALPPAAGGTAAGASGAVPPLGGPGGGGVLAPTPPFAGGSPAPAPPAQSTQPATPAPAPAPAPAAPDTAGTAPAPAPEPPRLLGVPADSVRAAGNPVPAAQRQEA